MVAWVPYCEMVCKSAQTWSESGNLSVLSVCSAYAIVYLVIAWTENAPNSCANLKQADGAAIYCFAAEINVIRGVHDNIDEGNMCVHKYRMFKASFAGLHERDSLACT